MKCLAFLTSYPLDISVGSGVTRLLQGFTKGLEIAGHSADIIHPKSFTSFNYLNLANHRLHFNRQIATKDFSKYDLVIGNDFDVRNIK